jgi:hypothetical protein
MTSRKMGKDKRRAWQICENITVFLKGTGRMSMVDKESILEKTKLNGSMDTISHYECSSKENINRNRKTMEKTTTTTKHDRTTQDKNI